MLKKWNDSFPMTLPEYDCTFLLHFTDGVFDRKTLATSSAYGKTSNNGGRSHAALNPARLKFVQGVIFFEILC